jgi:hypothetical protein
MAAIKYKAMLGKFYINLINEGAHVHDSSENYVVATQPKNGINIKI